MLSALRTSSSRISPGAVGSLSRVINDTSVLMIVGNPNFAWAGVGPSKHYSPLAVDTNAIVPFQVSAQGFQSVSWRGLQIAKPSSIVNHVEFPPDDPARVGPTDSLSHKSRN